MNIFKAIEIYKRIPKMAASRNPLRVIRGLWVSGTHLDNITIDATLQVTGETSRHCEERAYTSKEDEAFLDGNINIIDFDTTEIQTQVYTVQNNEAYLEGNINIIDFDTNTIDVMYYTRSEQESYLEGNINIIEYNTDNIGVADYVIPKRYTTLPENTGRDPAEPTLLIKLFTSTALEWE